MLEPEATAPSRRIAMLIDGENAQPSLTEPMLAEAGRYGLVTVRRIYGDWTTPTMNSWKEVLHRFAIQPIQQFRYTTGKNSTDSMMIIDAMDILHTGNVNGFCLVSSDSDYTRLATRIREEGLFVMGIGRKTTPEAFVKACEIFVYTENLLAVEASAGATRAPRSAANGEGSSADPLPLLTSAFEMSVQDDGWASLGTLGNRLHQLDSSFDPRTYGFKQLSQLIRHHSDVFELRERKTRDGASTIYIRRRASPAPRGESRRGSRQS